MIRRPPRSTRTDTLCPYTTLFRSGFAFAEQRHDLAATRGVERHIFVDELADAIGIALLHRDLPVDRRDHHLLALVPGRTMARARIVVTPFGTRDIARIIVPGVGYRSVERRVGKECVGTC